MAKTAKNKPQKIEDKIKALKEQIVANSKDAKWGKDALRQLTSLQKQLDVEAVELVVPTKEVKQSLDFGAYTLKRTPRGILFTAKGGMDVWVSARMSATWGMLNRVFELTENMPENVEAQEYAEAYKGAVAYICQSPIFASMGENMLFSMASHMLQEFNTYCVDNIDNAALHEETDDDIKANIEAENMAEFIDNAVKETKGTVI